MKGKEQNLIIKKIVKNDDEEPHGGQWKVAYADFITALMSFFLVLWLVTMIAPEKRARVALYFKYFSLFEKSGLSLMEKSSEIFNEAGESRRKVPKEMTFSFTNPEEFKKTLKTSIEGRLGDIKDQILVDIFEGGVRIQLVDKEGKPMFDVGSSKPTPLAVRILRVIAENIENMQNPIAIEGHTDSLSYNSSYYNNWDLSTERALTARKILEDYGLNPDQFIQVAGYSDTQPLITENPKDPRNRRISIILRFPKQ